MRIYFNWKNFRNDKPEIGKLIILKYHFQLCNGFKDWKTVFVLGKYDGFENEKHWIYGAELNTNSFTKKQILAYNFYDDINKFRYNHPNKKDECDFEWDYYNWL